MAGGWLEPLGRYGFNRAMRVEAVNAGRIGRLQPRAFYHPAESLALTFDRRGGDGRSRRRLRLAADAPTAASWR